MATNKAPASKIIHTKIYGYGTNWTVHSGVLEWTNPGNPGMARLFESVAEKLPYASLPAVRKHMKQNGLRSQGVYIAHDSMGSARYIGRGNIFARLDARRSAQPLELAYFSFYVLAEKRHEREIETLLIRAAGPLLEFNTKKKRVGIAPGNIHDYEAGTRFYERHYKKGKKA